METYPVIRVQIPAQFIYSSHNTREEAEAALEDYYASGEIIPGEGGEVKFYLGRWRVLLDS